MTLDRTWYNTLVDDDGSGIVGSVWDKEDVNQLMLAIDAEFATKLRGSGWVPGLTTATGGTPGGYSAQNALMARAGGLVYISGHLAINSKGSLAGGNLYLTGLPFPAAYYTAQAGVTIGYYSGMGVPVVGLGAYFDPNQSQMALTYLPPGGSGQTTVLDVTQIAANFTIVFGGCYLTDAP